MMITSSQTTPLYISIISAQSLLQQYKTNFRIIHIMYFVKNHKLDITDQISALIKHASQYFRCHDQTIGFRVDLDVASQYTHRVRRKCLLKITELLI